MHTTRSNSSLSHRPSSVASRAPSSLSRPSSSASHRTTSKASHRPGSRHSQRPPTRQSTRLAPLCQDLVVQVTGLSPETDEDEFRIALDLVSKSVDQVTKLAAGLDMNDVNKQLRGHETKARIHSHSNLADALNLSRARLQLAVQQEADLSQEIKIAKLPDHLQFLLFLSSPVSSSSLKFAVEMLERSQIPTKAPLSLSWNDILAEEPFEGQHWQGAYGLPPGSVVDTWDNGSSSEDISPSITPLDDSDGFDALSSVSLSEPVDLDEDVQPPQANRSVWEENLTHSLRHREDLESLQRRQYWREDWRSDALQNQKFDIGDPSTLGPSFHRALGDFATLSFAAPERERNINEHDAVREVLMGLQGNSNLMLEYKYDGSEFVSVVAAPAAPRLLHFTYSSQISALSSFAETATAVVHLKDFVRSVFSQTPVSGCSERTSSPTCNSRTAEAFAEAVDFQVRKMEKWCTKREEMMLLCQAGKHPSTVVSLLELEKAFRDEFSETYLVLFRILRETEANSLFSPTYSINMLKTRRRLSPSSFAAVLLDAIFNTIQSRNSMGDIKTASSLMQVFAQSANPVWSMMGRWLNGTMSTLDTNGGHTGAIKLDDEFFIESNDLGLTDPDFWADGYVLRGFEDEKGDEVLVCNLHIPMFLESIATAVLGAGKSISILHALECSDAFGPWKECSWITSWPSFEIFIKDNSTMSCDHINDQLRHEQTADESPGIIPSVDVPLLVSDRLVPFCQATGKALKHVLLIDCDLWGHLRSIEDFYFMRRGDSMSHFCDVVFARMNNRQIWSDFHFLNTAFRDVVEAGGTPWIDTSLVRLSFRGKRETTINQTVRGLEGLSVEYDAPFPLIFIFGPRTSQIYNAIFVFLLQIRRAKVVLESILVRGSVARGTQMVGDLKIFYAMRSRLSWFVNALLNFVATNVLQSELIRFHAALKAANSLDEIVNLHQNHMEKLEGRCLLHQRTSALRRAILAILDMSIHFSDCFTTFSRDTTTHDISRNSISITKRHRSRRIRHQRRNTVAFSPPVQDAEDESQDSDSDYDETKLVLRDDEEPAISFASSISFAEESFPVRVDKMSSELDGLVRFIRRGVESLVSGGGEAAPAFEVFAFALEDWDK